MHLLSYEKYMIDLDKWPMVKMIVINIKLNLLDNGIRKGGGQIPLTASAKIKLS